MVGEQNLKTAFEMLEEQKPKGERPKWRGNIEVVCWEKLDRNGEKYLSCQTASNFRLFINKERGE